MTARQRGFSRHSGRVGKRHVVNRGYGYHWWYRVESDKNTNWNNLKLGSCELDNIGLLRGRESIRQKDPVDRCCCPAALLIRPHWMHVTNRGFVRDVSLWEALVLTDLKEDSYQLWLMVWTIVKYGRHHGEDHSKQWIFILGRDDINGGWIWDGFFLWIFDVDERSGGTRGSRRCDSIHVQCW